MAKKERWSNECITESERYVLANALDVLVVAWEGVTFKTKRQEEQFTKLRDLRGRFSETYLDGDWDSENGHQKANEG